MISSCMDGGVTAEQLFYEFWTELQASEASLQAGESVLFAQKRLEEVFNKQYDRLKNKNSALLLYYDTHIKYILTVAADEYFIDRYEEWVSNLFEEKVFHTHIGGVKIFDNIRHLLQSKSETELGVFYILLLGIGFKGQYHQNPQELLAIKRALFELVHERSYNAELENIFECTDEKLIESAQPKVKQASYHVWYIAVAVAYLGMSYAIWEWQASIAAREVVIGNHNSFAQ